MTISANTNTNTKAPHFVLVPSAGMGHLNPMTRLAAALSFRGCDVSLVSAQPTVSIAESNRISQLLSLFPKVKSLNLPLVHTDAPSNADPFSFRWDAIALSADNLVPLLRDDDISAVIVDVSLAHGYVSIAKKLNIPCYMLFPTCAALFSLFAYFPAYYCEVKMKTGTYSIGDIDIPGVLTVPRDSVIPFLRDPDHVFTDQFLRNGRVLPELDGVLINTWDGLEAEVMAAINKGRVRNLIPPVIGVGPLLPLDGRAAVVPLPGWLDRQPPRSVVYVCFGNRTAMTREQMRELGIGLESSGCRFLWVVKTKVVDRDEEGSGNIEEVLGEGFWERIKGRGLVVKGWVEQTEALGHPAVGGFVSHCGWNSVTEAAMAGMRMLGWPRNGDQRVNGEVVRRSGLGVWMEEWSWEAGGGVVGGEEIGKKVREMMEDEELRLSAARAGEEAKKAVGTGGTSDKALENFIASFYKV